MVSDNEVPMRHVVSADKNVTSILTHDLAFKVEPEKYLQLLHLQFMNVLWTYVIWPPAYKYVNSILTYDLAFKVEPEQCLCLA